MSNLEKFTQQFIGKRILDERNVILIENKLFLIDEKMKEILNKVNKRPFYLGMYIGKSKGDKFFPSFALLKKISNYTNNKIWIDDKTEWLFTCGRDIFSEGITNVTGHKDKGGVSLIFNRQNDLLGFGKITQKIDRQGVVVKNILDIGDFFRREHR